LPVYTNGSLAKGRTFEPWSLADKNACTGLDSPTLARLGLVRATDTPTGGGDLGEDQARIAANDVATNIKLPPMTQRLPAGVSARTGGGRRRAGTTTHHRTVSVFHAGKAIRQTGAIARRPGTPPNKG
jgi:hypothetical protein